MDEDRCDVSLDDRWMRIDLDVAKNNGQMKMDVDAANDELD